MASDSNRPADASINWLRIALTASVLTLVTHCVVLWTSGLNGIQSPISQLSQQAWGELHTLGLISFACAHAALAIALAGLDRGRLWPFARALLVAAAATLVYVAYYFASADATTLRGPEANDPLWIVASLTGLVMGALQPGLLRLSRRVGLFNALCLGIWIALVPLILLVNDRWLGAYERIVGTVYVTWMAGIALGLISLSAMRSRGSASSG